jgi:Protein of unknown function (DUF3108)
MKLMKKRNILTTIGLIYLSLNMPILSAAQQNEVPVETIPPKLTSPETVTSGTTAITAKLKGYVFGLPVIKVDASGSLTDGAYDMRADLYTSGVAALLKKFQIWATTTGRISDDRLYPVQHIQQNVDKKNRRVEMNYGPDTLDISIVPRLGSQGKPPATQKQRFESNDVLSAVLDMTMRGFRFTEEPCTGTVPVFDSKQHYLLRLEQAGTKKIKQKGFKGETITCKIYYVPISGFDPEDLPSEEEVSTPVIAYLAKYDDVGLYIPVKLTYKISIFKAVVKLRELNITKN